MQDLQFVMDSLALTNQAGFQISPPLATKL